jgi:DNA-binding response OmpR family regulator
LLRQDYTADTAHDGEEALILVQRNGYNLVILDLDLLKVDGMEVRILASHPSTRILVLTALSASEDREDALVGAAHDYIVKPFHFSELLARVRDMQRGMVVGH